MKKNYKIAIEPFLIKLYIIIIVFEGAIRYILNLFKLPELIYVKDFIIIVLTLYGIKRTKLGKEHFITLFIISVSFIISMIYIGNFAQIMFFILKFVLFLA